MAHFVIYKRPAEVTNYEVDFSDLLPSPDTKADINLSRVTAFDSAGVDQTAYFIQRVTFSTWLITAILVNGLNGEDYTIYFDGVGDSTLLKKSRVLEVRVRSKLSGNL